MVPRLLFQLGVILFLIFEVTVAVAADMNAPLSEQPTLASEINRGFAASETCFFVGPSAYPDKSNRCILRASDDYEQTHVVYKPFQAGLFLGAWYFSRSDVQPAFIKSSDGNFPKDYDVIARDDYRNFRSIQLSLRITDDQMISALKTGMNDAGRSDLKKLLGSWTVPAD